MNSSIWARISASLEEVQRKKISESTDSRQIEERHVQALTLIDEMTSDRRARWKTLSCPGDLLVPRICTSHVLSVAAPSVRVTELTGFRGDRSAKFVIPYLNRLSDALFVMARYENHEQNVPEPLWNTLYLIVRPSAKSVQKCLWHPEEICAAHTCADEPIVSMKIAAKTQRDDESNEGDFLRAPSRSPCFAAILCVSTRGNNFHARRTYSSAL